MFAPGTVIDSTSDHLNPLACIPDVLWVSGGLVLSQIREITGLETAVIQNWVKRGYVAPPTAKHYSKDQTARILTINALRESLRLDQIAKLISSVNGSLVDSSDDLIPDSALYEMFCQMVVPLYRDNYLSFEQLGALADAHTASIEHEPARRQIRNALLLMCVCYQSTLIKRHVESLIAAL